MRKLIFGLFCMQLAVFISASTTTIHAAENTYKLEYQNKKSLIKLLRKEFDVSLKYKQSKNDTLIYESKHYQVKVKDLDLDEACQQTIKLIYRSKDLDLTLDTKEVDVDVVDDKAPVITSEDTITIEKGDSFEIGDHVTTDEVCKLDYDQFNTNTAGTYQIEVSATDLNGNKSTKQITVEVEDFYQKIADAALAQVGVQQDCTMLVTNSLKAVGIDFHGSPSAYLSLGELTDDPVPGDICVYSGHVAIYIGNGQAVHGGWNGYQTVVSSVQCSNALIGYVHVNH